MVTGVSKLIPARLSVEGWGIVPEGDDSLGYALLPNGSIALVLPAEQAVLALEMLCTLTAYDGCYRKTGLLSESFSALADSLKRTVEKTGE